MLYLLECPLHTQSFGIKDVFNWTATYRYRLVKSCLSPLCFVYVVQLLHTHCHLPLVLCLSMQRTFHVSVVDLFLLHKKDPLKQVEMKRKCNNISIRKGGYTISGSEHNEVDIWRVCFIIFRTDSTVVAPYERWQYYDENQHSMVQNKNYASNKTKAVAWFVSNCGARNGRLDYAKQLQKYIQVNGGKENAFIICK